MPDEPATLADWKSRRIGARTASNTEVEVEGITRCARPPPVSGFGLSR